LPRREPRWRASLLRRADRVHDTRRCPLPPIDEDVKSDRKLDHLLRLKNGPPCASSLGLGVAAGNAWEVGSAAGKRLLSAVRFEHGRGCSCRSWW